MLPETNRQKDFIALLLGALSPLARFPIPEVYNPKAALPLTNGVNPPWENELLEKRVNRPRVTSPQLPMIRGASMQAGTTIGTGERGAESDS